MGRPWSGGGGYDSGRSLGLRHLDRRTHVGLADAHRWLACDYERRPATSEAVIRWVGINTMTRRITQGRLAPGPNTVRCNSPTEITSQARSQIPMNCR